MKLCRKICVCLLLITSLLSLSACGGERPEATTVYVDKKGNLKQILVDPAPDYSPGELQTYTEDRIAAYNKAHTDADVQLNSCTEEEGVIYAELSYGSFEDYTGFNSMDCFLGTLEEAQTAGMIPEEQLIAAGGEAVDIAALLAEHPEYHILSLSEHTLVQTETAILGSGGTVVITGETTAVFGDGDAGTSGYYPRKTEAAGWLIFE
ncbi:MAG: hypothetical protein Q4B03_02615 [Lachnospiraceae bacterium]|nr:hypothetical protein [Lachnospiraceae bacterium]